MSRPFARFIEADPHNYGSRKGAPVEFLVLHTAEDTVDGSLEGTASWFRDPDAQSSAHYGVATNGDLYQFVDESYAAWHAGNGHYNRRSIGIELEGRASGLGDTLSNAQYATLLALCRHLANQYRIPVDQTHILGHCHVPHPTLPGVFGGISRHTDPGPHFPWDRFIRDLKEESNA